MNTTIPFKKAKTALIFLFFIMTQIGCSEKIAIPVKELSRISTPDTLLTKEQKPTFHTVHRGENLASIAWIYRTEIEKIAELNNLAPPYQLKVGQRLVLSDSFPPNQRNPAIDTSQIESNRVQYNKEQSAIIPTVHDEREKIVSIEQNSLNKESSDWVWPARGELSGTFSTLKNGIDIRGEIGTPVVASASGKVVYAGDNLAGYGRMILIQHENKNYLSAYAHNKKLLAKEGMYVKKSQEIAIMGSTGTTEPKLHFEIRYKGNPVNPEKLLPRR